jgi:raffinose/stachyose/melibiose transport system permease protein
MERVVKDRKKRRINIGRIPCYLIISIWAITEIFMYTWMFYSSFKNTPEIYQDMLALPKSLKLDNYIEILSGRYSNIYMGRYLINSAIVALISLGGILLISTCAGYSLSKKSKVTDLLFYYFLVMIAIPTPSIIIPVYYQLDYLGLANNLLGISLTYIAFNTPFSIVLSRAFFKLFPKELEDAGKIDGLSDLGVFARIVLPSSRSLLIVLTVINFPNVWNELFYALVLLTKNEVRTVQPGIMMFFGAHDIQWGDIFAGLTLSALPVIVVYIIFQRYIAQQLILGAIKG